MGLLNAIGGIFGYDRGAHDSAVDAAKDYRDQTNVWAVQQYRNINDLIEQSKFVWRAARDIRAAGIVAMGMAHENARMIIDEFNELIRRRGDEQKSIESTTLARAAASGTTIDKGSSSDIYMKTQKSTHGKELAWMGRARDSQSKIALQQGEIAMLEAEAGAKQTESAAMGMGIAAREGRLAIQQAQAQAEMGIEAARANRSAARTGMYGNIITTGLSVVGLNPASIISGIMANIAISSGGGQVKGPYQALTKTPTVQQKAATAVQWGTHTSGGTFSANPLAVK